MIDLLLDSVTVLSYLFRESTFVEGDDSLIPLGVEVSLERYESELCNSKLDFLIEKKTTKDVCQVR